MVAIDHASTFQVLMLSASKLKNDILVSTRSKYYGNQLSSSNNQADQPNPSTSTSYDPIPPPITPELTIKPPKGVVHKSTFNPRALATQNYNRVEDLAQSPYAMSMLEVLQNCPSQKQALLSAIGGIDPTDSNLVVFNHASYMPQLPVQLAFLIQVNALNKLVHRTIINEGASTFIMSMNRQKTLGTSPLSRSPTMLKSFDSRTYIFWHYNILLGRPWVYAMVVVGSTYFHTIAFPHMGGITVIDQLAFFASISQATGHNPLVNRPLLSLQNIGAGLFKDSSLMGTFRYHHHQTWWKWQKLRLAT